MDAQAILNIIETDAKQAAERSRQEAQDRVLSIREQSDLRIEEMRKQTLERVAVEAAQLADRMDRLAELEDRKELLTAKRNLINRAFDEALTKLNQLPSETFGDIILSVIKQNAAGDELLIPGQINNGFFTPDFIQKANDALMKLGRPGQLSDSGQRLDDVSGLLLKTPQSELHCTIKALLNDKRDALEPAVAALLFPDNTL